jgi:hypothetical protein
MKRAEIKGITSLANAHNIIDTKKNKPTTTKIPLINRLSAPLGLDGGGAARSAVISARSPIVRNGGGEGGAGGVDGEAGGGAAGGDGWGCGGQGD